MAHARFGGEQVQHAAIVGEDIGGEAGNSVGRGDGENPAKEDPAEAASLPFVDDDQTEFGDADVFGSLVPRDGHQLRRIRVRGFGDQRHAVGVVDVRKSPGHLLTQFGKSGEEALIDRLRAHVMKGFDQSVVVFGADGPDVNTGAVAQGKAIAGFGRESHAWMDARRGLVVAAVRRVANRGRLLKSTQEAFVKTKRFHLDNAGSEPGCPRVKHHVKFLRNNNGGDDENGNGRFGGKLQGFFRRRLLEWHRIGYRDGRQHVIVGQVVDIKMYERFRNSERNMLSGVNHRRSLMIAAAFCAKTARTGKIMSILAAR